MPGSNLYFIALIPTPDICDEIMQFKHDLAARFESKAALKVVPHITLKIPFHLPDSEQERLLEWFDQLPVQTASFPIALKNFGAFPKRSPVIYVQPVENASLYTLQNDITRNFDTAFPEIEKTDYDAKFHPHMTIAYRDLKPELFQQAWEEYQQKNYHASFEVNGFYLLKHDGTRWNVIRTHELR